jgi:hypothetical protein
VPQHEPTASAVMTVDRGDGLHRAGWWAVGARSVVINFVYLLYGYPMNVRCPVTDTGAVMLSGELDVSSRRFAAYGLTRSSNAT